MVLIRPHQSFPRRDKVAVLINAVLLDSQAKSRRHVPRWCRSTGILSMPTTSTSTGEGSNQ